MDTYRGNQVAGVSFISQWDANCCSDFEKWGSPDNKSVFTQKKPLSGHLFVPGATVIAHVLQGAFSPHVMPTNNKHKKKDVK